jgi:hypothetical protein
MVREFENMVLRRITEPKRQKKKPEELCNKGLCNLYFSPTDIIMGQTNKGGLDRWGMWNAYKCVPNSRKQSATHISVEGTTILIWF